MARMIPCLVLVLCTAFLGGCDAFGPEMSLGRASPRERSHSLFEVRNAWDFRPEGTDDTERRFLNRYGSFAKKLNGTDAAKEAADLWRRIYAEYQHRFPED